MLMSVMGNVKRERASTWSVSTPQQMNVNMPSGAKSVGAPPGAPLHLNRQNSSLVTPRIYSPLVTPRAGAHVVGAPRTATKTGYAGQTVLQTTPRKENLSSQIVEKKGDVVVWGPGHGRDRQGARLPRIICYGDSNTAGYHSGGREFQPYGQSLASELADMGMPCEVAVCGLCSFTTQDMLNERSSDRVRAPIGPHGRGLERMLNEDGPVDLVIIMTGTNDLGSGMHMTTIMQQIAQLHGICHQRGVPTVAIAPTQSSGRPSRMLRQQLADSIAKWASSTTGVLGSLDVEDLLPRPVSKDGASSNPAAAVNWEPDDLHLSAVGSIALGRRLASHASTWLQSAAPAGTDAAKASNRTVTKGCSVPTQLAVGCSTSIQASKGCSFATQATAGRTPLEALPRTHGLNLSNKTAAIPASKKVVPLHAAGGCGFALANSQRRHHHTQKAQFPAARYAC